MNPGSDQSVSARGRAALMRMRFEIDIERSAASFAAGLLKRENFGVLSAIVGVNPGSLRFSVRINNDRSDIGIGRC